MIVVDASLVIEALVNDDLGTQILERLMEGRHALIAPHLLDVEVLSGLRGLAEVQRIDKTRIDQYLSDFARLPVQRHSHELLLPRMWELRHNFTAYDAAYIALAEATGSILFTCDRKLRRGHRAEVVVFSDVVH